MLKGTALATHNFRHFFNVLSTPLTLPPRFYSQCIITRQINPDYLILFEAKSQDFFPQLTWSTIVTSAFVIFNLHALELSFYRDYFTWPQHTHRARSSLGEVLVCGRSWRDTSWQTSAIIDKLSKRIQSPIQYEIASRFSITSLYPRLYPRLYPHPSQLDLPFPAFPGIPLTSANQNHMYPVKKKKKKRQPWYLLTISMTIYRSSPTVATVAFWTNRRQSTKGVTPGGCLV